MSFQQPVYSPPEIPVRLMNARDFQGLRDGVKEHLRQERAYAQTFMNQFVNNHNKNAQAFGPDIASAAVIQVDPSLQQIATGAVAIDTITPPAKFNGFKALYSRDGFSLTTAGNIATALSTTAGTLVLLLYFPPTQKWAVISAVFAGTLPANSVGAAQIQSGAVTTAKIANAAITTPLLASGAATKGTPTLDVTSQAITPYDTEVQIVSSTVTIDATSDFVQGSVGIIGTGANLQSLDQIDYFVRRNGTAIQTAPLKLTLSTATVVGGQWVAFIDFTDTGQSGSVTYSVGLKTHNGSGNGTFAETKTVAQMLIVDHRAQ